MIKEAVGLLLEESDEDVPSDLRGYTNGKTT